jgi:hypothetical protein
MKTALTTAAFLALAVSTVPSVAQDKTIGGVAVPPEQLEEIQLKCEVPPRGSGRLGDY